jgi:hypothetical protein
MSKRKFDLELFWSLPRGESDLYSDGRYCALGAGLKAAGCDIETASYEKWYGILEEWGGYHYDLEDIYFMNDTGRLASDRSGKDPKPNHERAKRMLIEHLIKKDLVEFTEDPLTFKLPAEVKETVNV